MIGQVPPCVLFAPAESLTSALEATYGLSLYSSVPRLVLAKVQCWLIPTYRGDLQIVRSAAIAVLQSLAYDVTVELTLAVMSLDNTATTIES